jgi:ribosome biogenesis GTPase
MATCRLRGNLKKELIRPESDSLRPRVQKTRRRRVTDPVAVGDRVVIDPAVAVIEEVRPRRSAIMREAPHTGDQHTLLANLDQAVIVFSTAQPRFDPWQLDRFLVAAEAAEVDLLLCINKIDLVPVEEMRGHLSVYERLGYDLLYTSAVDGRGVAELGARLRDKISVICGPSGVGKSLLLNALQPGLSLRVGEVGEVTRKGRHTTSQVELLPLDCGGWVADTPGLRQLGLWDVDPAELPYYFREFEPYLGQCYFTDCTHHHEPDCAIRAAVAAGAIDERRYRSFCQML